MATPTYLLADAGVDGSEEFALAEQSQQTLLDSANKGGFFEE